MSLSVPLVALTWLLSTQNALTAAAVSDPSPYARTTTGSIGGGNTFPGVSRPFSMVKLGPDMDDGRTDAYSGYLEEGRYTGFSMLHLSGTGGAPKYGVVSQMPYHGSLDVSKLDPFSVSEERQTADVSSLGYYNTTLKSGVVVELAASDRAGMYQYTFPESTDKGPQNHVIVDVSHVLTSYRGQGLEQQYQGGKIGIVYDSDGKVNRYEGYGEYDNGWNRAPTWRVYFCGYFDETVDDAVLFTNATEADSNPHAAFVDLNDCKNKKSSCQAPECTQTGQNTTRLGAMFSFDKPEVRSRVGVSFISTNQACRNVEEQIPSNVELTDLVKETQEEWNKQLFSKFQTDETDEIKLQQLYTSLYFMHLLPTNKTGENPLWESSEPYYDDIVTFWDTHRCATSLLHITHPKAYEEILRSSVDVWKHEGFMSDARSSFSNGVVQGGSNVVNVLADAYVKGLKGQMDWDQAYSAMTNDAEKTPPLAPESRDSQGSIKEGRGALEDWLSKGYITNSFSRSVSQAVEYACNDFAVAQVARGLGHDDDADKYLGRSLNWRNHWNPDMEALDIKGFVGPIDTDGNFVSQDPLDCGGCYWGDAYYQGLPWEYSLNVPHDLEHAVTLAGGLDLFRKRLELTFEKDTVSRNEQFGRTIHNPGNQPSFILPYLFNYIGRQDLSVYYSQNFVATHFSPTPDGLPGNEDVGSMSAWLLWSMIGLYPVTGQTTFLIGAPTLTDLQMTLPSGDLLKITTNLADIRKSGSDKQPTYYVQSLKVNGEEWTKSWLTWDDIFKAGGSLDFTLGEEPSTWSFDGPFPPSPASIEK